MWKWEKLGYGAYAVRRYGLEFEGADFLICSSFIFQNKTKYNKINRFKKYIVTDIDTAVFILKMWKASSPLDCFVARSIVYSHT